MTVDDRGPGCSVQPGFRVRIRGSSGRWQEVRIPADDDRTMLPALDIPADCPLATALLGKTAGDQVCIELRAGVRPVVLTVVRVV
jgi:transcription elongation GreA/GreB family factor